MKDKENDKAEKVKKPAPKKTPTKSYELLRDVKVGSEVKKKGSKIDLTEKGRLFFKSKNYIK